MKNGKTYTVTRPTNAMPSPIARTFQKLVQNTRTIPTVVLEPGDSFRMVQTLKGPRSSTWYKVKIPNVGIKYIIRAALVGQFDLGE